MEIGQLCYLCRSIIQCNILFNQFPMEEYLVFFLVFTIIPIATVNIFAQTSLYLLLFPYDKFPDGISKSSHGMQNCFPERFYQLHSQQQHVKPLGDFSESHSLNTCFLSNYRCSLVILSSNSSIIHKCQKMRSILNQNMSKWQWLSTMPFM